VTGLPIVPPFQRSTEAVTFIGYLWLSGRDRAVCCGISMDRFHWTRCAVHEYVSDSCKRRLTVAACSSKGIVVAPLHGSWNESGALPVRLRDGVGDPEGARGGLEGQAGRTGPSSPACACRKPAARRGAPSAIGTTRKSQAAD
jgi:hypothetical protein